MLDLQSNYEAMVWIGIGLLGGIILTKCATKCNHLKRKKETDVYTNLNEIVTDSAQTGSSEGGPSVTEQAEAINNRQTIV